eukprot:COSAG02_NODE_15519_length_1163_cov_6.037594_1_plen_97_part_00
MLHAATLPLAHSGLQIVQQLRAATLPQADTAAAATRCNLAGFSNVDSEDDPEQPLGLGADVDVGAGAEDEDEDDDFVKLPESGASAPGFSHYLYSW